MCGRFNVTSDPLQSIFMDLVGQSYPGEDNYNTAPTTQTWIIRASQRNETLNEAVEARWWLVPNWASELSTKYAMFNSRCENLTKSKAFSMPFRRQRCVVPIAGYYEWQRKDELKQPYYISHSENNGLLLAGIWDEWDDQIASESLTSFSIVTVPAHETIEFVHHRQPAFLSFAHAKQWLSSTSEEQELLGLLQPGIPRALSATPVSTYVGNTKNQGKKCIEPIADSTFIPAT